MGRRAFAPEFVPSQSPRRSQTTATDAELRPLGPRAGRLHAAGFRTVEWMLLF